MNKKLLKTLTKNAHIVLESVKRNEAGSSQSGSPILGSACIKGMTAEGVLNQNGRVYSEAVWSQPTAFGLGGDYLDENGNLKPATLFGSLDHPMDDRTDFRLEEAAIAWTKVTRNSDGTYDGEFDTLDNPKGRVVQNLLEYAKYKNTAGLLGVSSRAMGEATIRETAEGSVEEIIPEGFSLVAFDFVYNPSFRSALVNLQESKKEVKSLTESIKGLANTDPTHKEYYNAVAEALLNEDKTLDKLLSNIQAVEVGTHFLIVSEDGYISKCVKTSDDTFTVLEDNFSGNDSETVFPITLEDLEQAGFTADNTITLDLTLFDESKKQQPTNEQALTEKDKKSNDDEEAKEDDKTEKEKKKVEDEESELDDEKEKNKEEKDDIDKKDDKLDGLEKDKDEDKATIESLAKQVSDLTEMLSQVLAYLAPVEDSSLDIDVHVDDLPADIEVEEELGLYDDLTDEDLDNLDLDELEYLANLPE